MPYQITSCENAVLAIFYKQEAYLNTENCWSSEIKLDTDISENYNHCFNFMVCIKINTKKLLFILFKYNTYFSLSYRWWVQQFDSFFLGSSWVYLLHLKWRRKRINEFCFAEINDTVGKKNAYCSTYWQESFDFSCYKISQCNWNMSLFMDIVSGNFLVASLKTAVKI